MRKYILESLGTDQIDEVNFDDLEKNVDGESVCSKTKYRRQVKNMYSGKKPQISKGEIVKKEMRQADLIADF